MHVVKRLGDQKFIKCDFDFQVIEGLPDKLKWIGFRTLDVKPNAIQFYETEFYKIDKQRAWCQNDRGDRYADNAA